MKYIRDVIYTVIIILLTMLCFHFGFKEPEVKTEMIVKCDTIVKVDTFTVEKEKIKYVDRIKIDTLYLHDTIFIKEQINYRDSIASIWISGFQPEIDSIHYKIPEKTIYVDKVIEVPKKDSFWKNRFVITAGFSTTYGLVHKQWDVGPSLTVGIRLY